jgi:phosphoribosylformylglycinamidine (FGAM) synthase-like enzyme
VNYETSLRPDMALFSESQSRILISVDAENLENVRTWMTQSGVPCQILGQVKNEGFNVKINGKNAVSTKIDTLLSAWKDAIPCLMGQSK